MGNSNFRRSQIAVESVYGTAVAGALQLVGALNMRNAPERERREERRNSMGGSNTYDDLAYRSEGTYSGRVVVNELPYWLSAAIAGVTPTGSNPYVWEFAQPLTSTELAATPLKSLTGYVGDNQQALRTAGMYVRRVTIRGTDTGAWMIECDILGREQVTGTFASLNTPTNSTIKNLLSTIAIDDAGADIGDTVIAATAYSFTWVWDSGIEPDYTMDGQLDMTGVQRGEPSCTLEIIAKWNATTVAEFGDWRTIGTRFIRIKNTNSASSEVTIDGAYVYTDFDAMNNEQDGTTRTRMMLTAIEDETWAEKVVVTVTNTLASL